MFDQAAFNALCYELALLAAKQWPSIRFQPWFIALLAWCKPDWVEQKTQKTLEVVDEQIEEVKEQWEKEEHQEKVEAAEGLATKAKELFPSAIVTPFSGAIVPSVIIEKKVSENASDAVKTLGGEIRITYRLDNFNV